MVVGLIQLAHKMSRAPLLPVLPDVPLASCAILCYALLSTSCSLSLCSLLSLPLSVYFRSQMWHGLNLGFTSASHSFVCCCLPSHHTPLAIVLFIMYLFHFYILTFSFFLRLSFSP